MAKFKKHEWNTTIVEGEDFKVRKKAASPTKAFKNKKQYSRKGKYQTNYLD